MGGDLEVFQTPPAGHLSFHHRRKSNFYINGLHKREWEERYLRCFVTESGRDTGNVMLKMSEWTAGFIQGGLLKNNSPIKKMKKKKRRKGNLFWWLCSLWCPGTRFLEISLRKGNVICLRAYNILSSSLHSHGTSIHGLLLPSPLVFYARGHNPQGLKTPTPPPWDVTYPSLSVTCSKAKSRER